MKLIYIYIVAGWKDHATRRVLFKSPESGFYWHTWGVMVLLLAEVLSVVSRCGWISLALVTVLIGYPLWNRAKVSLLSHGEVSHPSSMSTLLMCRWVDEPQVWPISPWWLLSRCSSWVSRATLMWTQDARHNIYIVTEKIGHLGVIRKYVFDCKAVYFKIFDLMDSSIILSIEGENMFI